MAGKFILLPVAKAHLRIIGADNDDEITWCIEQGESIIVNYLKVDDTEWDIGSPPIPTLPKHINAAMMRSIEALFKGEDPLSDSIKASLSLSRDPTLA